MSRYDRRRVVISGIGMITPLGANAEATWQAARNGEVGIAPISAVRLKDQEIEVAAELKNFDPADHFPVKEARRMDRVTQIAIVAAREAFQSAGLKEGQWNPEDAGVICASGIGGLASIEKNNSLAVTDGYRFVSPFFIPMSIVNTSAAMVAMDLGFKGLCTCTVTACAAATNAIGEAFHRIRDGYETMMLAGGSEAAITPMGLFGFSAMKALSKSTDPKRASIPFDAERTGFVMGEGAAFLFLEEYEHAMARKAKIYAEVVGYGATCDAYHITAPDPAATQATRCFTLCLKDAGIEPEEVGYINAHGTSTTLNDESETKAIKQAFAAHASKLKISSTKSMTGHLLGASGAVEAAVTAFALREQEIPPTAGLQVPDPACDLDYVPIKGIAHEFNYALSNSLGFGGHNACIALARFVEER